MKAPSPCARSTSTLLCNPSSSKNTRLCGDSPCHYSRDRLEQACARALAIHSASYQSITSILKQRLDQLPLPQAEEEPELTELQVHTNVCSPHYYH